jgi:hypothetical protein
MIQQLQLPHWRLTQRGPKLFAQRYGAVFPSAAFTDLYRARAICWQQPSGTRARREGQ